MSRATKTSDKKLFTKLLQKPSTPEFSDEVQLGSPSPKSFPKTGSSLRETAAFTGALDSSIFSSTKVRVALRVSELFEELRSQNDKPDLSMQMMMCRSAPRVSMTMLNNNKENQKKLRNISSLNEIKSVKTTTEISALSSKQGKRLKSLVSLNPYAMEPKEMLEGFFEMTGIEDQVYVVALIYLQRALDMELDLEFKHLHKLLAGCLLLAFKFLIEGQFWSFEDFGFLCGVRGDQVERIEKCVLRRELNYDLYVSDEEYEEALGSLFTSEAF